jgi:hypothetical protein
MTKAQRELAMRRMFDRMDTTVIDMSVADKEEQREFDAGNGVAAAKHRAEAMRLFRRYMRQRECVIRIAAWGER